MEVEHYFIEDVQDNCISTDGKRLEIIFLSHCFTVRACEPFVFTVNSD